MYVMYELSRLGRCTASQLFNGLLVDVGVDKLDL